MLFRSAVDPLEALLREIQLVQGRTGPVDGVEVPDPLLEAAEVRLLQQLPLQRGVVVPLESLAELPPHEEQLFPGVRPHVAQQEAQVILCLSEVIANNPQVAPHLFSVSDQSLKQDLVSLESILTDSFDRIEELHRNKRSRSKSVV